MENNFTPFDPNIQEREILEVGNEEEDEPLNFEQIGKINGISVDMIEDHETQEK
jgi:hypothetical protein